MGGFFSTGLVLFCLMTAILFTSLPAGAAGDDFFISKQKKFIKSLYYEKDYFNSIAEARRLQSEDKSPELDYFIYLNYFFAGQYKTVVQKYNYSSGRFGLCAGSLVSMSYFNLGMYDESYRALSIYNYSGRGREDMTLFLRRITPLLFSGGIERIREEESAAKKFLKDDYNFTSLRMELARFRETGLKSSCGSAIMSAIVPGAGQLYSGYPVDSLISFAAVASTALGGIYLNNRGKDGYSYTLFFFTGLFHAGNVYGAYNSAVRRNRSIINNEYKIILDRYGEYEPSSCIDIERLLH